MPKCRYCEHDKPGDLVRVVDDFWAHRFWMCASSFFCDCRATARGLDRGEHLEAQR